MTKEVLQQALEALTYCEALNRDVQRQKMEAITAIKEALAQSEQEPFGWYSAQVDEFMTHKIRKEHERLNSYTHKVGKFDLALYTTPPQRKPLSNELIEKIVDENTEDDQGYDIWCNGVGVARAIEAAHGITGE